MKKKIYIINFKTKYIVFLNIYFFIKKLYFFKIIKFIPSTHRHIISKYIKIKVYMLKSKNINHNIHKNKYFL